MMVYDTYLSATMNKIDSKISIKKDNIAFMYTTLTAENIYLTTTFHKAFLHIIFVFTF